MRSRFEVGAAIALLCSAIAVAQGPPSPEKNSDRPRAENGVEILTDTKGVDFRVYIQQVQKTIKRNWYSVIPQAAMPPLLEKGKLSIQFAILKNGQITDIHYLTSSGRVELDRAAYFGISASNPFPPLPSEFLGQSVELRITFLYNPPLKEGSPSLAGISPPHLKIPAGSSVMFVPIINGMTDHTEFPIRWTVAGQGCAQSVCGTISEDGMYTAPPKVPDNPTITIKATAVADLSETASAVVTILPAEQRK